MSSLAVAAAGAGAAAAAGAGAGAAAGAAAVAAKAPAVKRPATKVARSLFMLNVLKVVNDVERMALSLTERSAHNASSAALVDNVALFFCD